LRSIGFGARTKGWDRKVGSKRWDERKELDLGKIRRLCVVFHEMSLDEGLKGHELLIKLFREIIASQFDRNC